MDSGVRQYSDTVVAATSLGLVWLGDALIYVVLPLYPTAFGVETASVARPRSRAPIFMTEPLRPRAKYVIGPDGSPLTIADLPAPGTKRWVIRRKAEVVAAVRGGLLSLEEACSRYTLTVEEFLSWQYSIDQHGLAGLRTTRIQQYRQ